MSESFGHLMRGEPEKQRAPLIFSTLNTLIYLISMLSYAFTVKKILYEAEGKLRLKGRIKDEMM